MNKVNKIYLVHFVSHALKKSVMLKTSEYLPHTAKYRNNLMLGAPNVAMSKAYAGKLEILMCIKIKQYIYIYIFSLSPLPDPCIAPLQFCDCHMRVAQHLLR